MRTFPVILTVSLLAACSPAEDDTPTDTGAEDSGGPDSADPVDDSAQDSADSANDSADTSPPDSAEDSGSDPDSGADSDSGGDTDDSGGDTDSGGGVDSGGDADPACATGTASDLTYSVEVRDALGAVGTTFSTADELTVAGIVSNPCPSDITFSTSSTCLVTDISMNGASGMGYGVSFSCGGAVTLWSVPAGGSTEVAEVVGRLPADTYDVTVNFNLRRTSATTTIAVR